MKFIAPIFALSLTMAIASQSWADNIAACELVLLEEIADSEMQGSAQVASYRSAADFMASVYDEEDGNIDAIDELPIRGVMCERSSVLPTVRDFPIVATGIPFSISENFDSTTSGLMTIYFKDGEFQHQYSGPDLTDANIAALKDTLEIFNLQPHDLTKRENK